MRKKITKEKIWKVILPENILLAYLTSVITYPVSGTYSSDFAHWNSYFLRACNSSIQMVNAGTVSLNSGLVHSGRASILV